MYIHIYDRNVLYAVIPAEMGYHNNVSIIIMYKV